MMTRLFYVMFFTLLMSCKGPQMADLIVHHAAVYTVDSAMTAAEAFAVKDGKFLAIGSNKEILDEYEAKETLDVEGKAVYPGFIDAHCHFYAYGLQLKNLDLVGTKSFEEVISKVIKYAEQNPNGWIKGRGWDQNDWIIKEYPIKDTLDKLFPNRPVYLSRVDGHAALVNQAALDAAGITISTKIEGGQLRQQNDRLTGILIDNATDSVRSAFPKPGAEDIKNALLNAQNECHAVGLTTVSDAGLEKRIVDAIEQLHRSGELKMRIYAMLDPTEENMDFYLSKGPYKTGSLSVLSFKIYADGSLGSRGAALLRPYADSPDHYGFLLHDTSYYTHIAKELYNAGFQMNTHCIGDSANRFLLNVYGKVLQGKNDRRWRIEHAQVVEASDMAKFSLFDIIPSVQPTHATSDMYWAEDRLGKDYMQGAYAYKSLLRQKGMIAIGSDFPVESINPLYGFYAAITRKDKKGYPEEGFRAEEALSREEALKGMTIWAAYANFEEKEKGSIERGKLADFVILDRDIMKIPAAEIPGTTVISTFTGGENVYNKK